jgi:hypothetical protein
LAKKSDLKKQERAIQAQKEILKEQSIPTETSPGYEIRHEFPEVLTSEVVTSEDSTTITEEINAAILPIENALEVEEGVQNIPSYDEFEALKHEKEILEKENDGLKKTVAILKQSLNDATHHNKLRLATQNNKFLTRDAKKIKHLPQTDPAGQYFVSPTGVSTTW